MSKIAIVLTEGFADWEYALIGGTGGPFYGLDVQYFACRPGQFRSQSGLDVVVSQSLDEFQKWRPDVVAVIGGTIWETGESPDISEVLLYARSLGATVAGICGDTLALARAGLLNGVVHTSNDGDFLKTNAAE